MGQKYFIFIGFVVYFFIFTIHQTISQVGGQNQPVYSVRMLFLKNDTVVLKDIHVETGTLSYFPITDTGYTIRVVSFDDKELFKANLGVSFIIVFESIGPIETDRMIVYARVPFYTSAKWITIQHLDKEILRIDLSEHICNKNGLCDLGENKYICATDCEKLDEGFSIVNILIPSLAVLIVIIIIFSKGKEKGWFDIKKAQKNKH